MIYMFGLMIMMLTDVEKYLVLRERRGLITHCMHAWSRNMNYVGEIMLYASFGMLVQRWEVWFVYSYMWGLVFMIRILTKDYSLSKKAGWAAYQQKTWLLIPKLFNSCLISYLIYGSMSALFYFTYSNGGIEATLKTLF